MPAPVAPSPASSVLAFAPVRRQVGPLSTMPVSPMTSAQSASAQSFGPPILVEVSRGDMVECRHRGSVAVVDIDGKVVFAAGDVESPVYARSAFKPLQAIPFVESGAADGEGVEQIAVACASHSGEARHTSTVAAWLGRL